MSVRSVFPPMQSSSQPLLRTARRIVRSSVVRAGAAKFREAASCACGVLAAGARARRGAGGELQQLARRTRGNNRQQRKRKNAYRKIMMSSEILLSSCGSVLNAVWAEVVDLLLLVLKTEQADPGASQPPKSVRERKSRVESAGIAHIGLRERERKEWLGWKRILH